MRFANCVLGLCDDFNTSVVSVPTWRVCCHVMINLFSVWTFVTSGLVKAVLIMLYPMV